MEKELLEERAKHLEEVIKDPSYVPMKAKEIRVLLGIPKSQRGELEEVLGYLDGLGYRRRENMEN